MKIPRLTCTGCGYRTLDFWSYRDHRATCDRYAAMRAEQSLLSDEFEHCGDSDEVVAAYNRRDQAIRDRYRRQWSDSES